MILESLGTFLRLARERRNMKPGTLADLAGVSRWQLKRVEEGHNVSVQFLLKIAAVLELTEIELGPLTLRTGRTDTHALLMAADALEKARRAVGGMENVKSDIEEAASAVDALLVRPDIPASSSRRVAVAADRLAKTPPQRAADVGRALRASAESSGKRVRTSRSEEDSPRVARRRAR